MKRNLNIILNFQIKEINYSFKFKVKKKIKKDIKFLKNKFFNLYQKVTNNSYIIYKLYKLSKKVKYTNLSKIQIQNFFYLNSNINKWKKKFKKIKINSFKIYNLNKKHNNNVVFISNSNNIKLKTLYLFYSYNMYTNINITYEFNEWLIDYFNSDIYIYMYMGILFIFFNYIIIL